MLNQVTIDKMQRMKLFGMTEALSRPARGSDRSDLSFEERLGLLVDAEWEVRESRKLTNRLRQARLRYPASLEDVDYAPRRNLDKKVVLALGTCEWIRENQNVVITGAAGTGKSYLACALAERACRSGFSAAYVRAARLMNDLAVARGDGSYRRLLVKLAKLDVLAIDDWLLTPPSDSERRSRCSSTPARRAKPASDSPLDLQDSMTTRASPSRQYRFLAAFRISACLLTCLRAHPPAGDHSFASVRRGGNMGRADAYAERAFRGWRDRADPPTGGPQG